MKKLLVVLGLVIGSLAGGVNNAHAKVSINVNINVQPGWGPVGYDYVNYYYFPDYNVYYDMNRSSYLVPGRSGWYYTTNIARVFNGFDPYRLNKVVVNDNPRQYNAQHKRMYASYVGKKINQSMIYNSNDHRYYGNKNHPQYGKKVNVTNDRSVRPQDKNNGHYTNKNSYANNRSNPNNRGR